MSRRDFYIISITLQPRQWELVLKNFGLKGDSENLSQLALEAILEIMWLLRHKFPLYRAQIEAAKAAFERNDHFILEIDAVQKRLRGSQQYHFQVPRRR